MKRGEGARWYLRAAVTQSSVFFLPLLTSDRIRQPFGAALFSSTVGSALRKVKLHDYLSSKLP